MDIFTYKRNRLQSYLNLGRRRRHIVIALLPLLEAEGAVEDLDVEDPKPALQLKMDDEGRSQPIELGEAFPAAEELRSLVDLSTFLADNNPGEHLPRPLASSDSVKKKAKGAVTLKRISNGLGKPLSTLDWFIKHQHEL